MFSFQLAANLRLVKGLFIEFGAAATPMGKEIPLTYSFTEYRFAAFQIAMFWSFWEKRRIHPMLGILGGTLVNFVSQIDKNDLKTQSNTEPVAYLGGTARMGIDLADALGMIIGMSAVSSIPELRIDQSDVRIGRPLINGFLNLEIRF